MGRIFDYVGWRTERGGIWSYAPDIVTFRPRGVRLAVSLSMRGARSAIQARPAVVARSLSDAHG